MEILRRLAYWWRRDGSQPERAAESRSHIDARIEELVSQGLTSAEALTQTRREFGNQTKHQEAVYESAGWPVIDWAWQDIRYCLRRLRLSPGFATCAVLSLALGIGANAAVFQLLNAVRLRSLPVAEPGELVSVLPSGNENQIYGITNGQPISFPIWKRVHDHAEAFAGSFAWGFTDFHLDGGKSRRKVRGAFVSAQTFATLGVPPVLGRLIDAADDHDGCDGNAAVVSHGFWLRSLGGRASAVGAKLVLEGRPFTVIGVTPSSFFGVEVGSEFEVALPLCAYALWNKPAFQRPDQTWLNVVGRLKPGWSRGRAASYLEGASAAWFDAEKPRGYDSSVLEVWSKLRLTAVPAHNGISGLREHYETSIWLLLGITALVVVIACTNLANLLLARSMSTSREIAVRMAIGASRGRLLSQLTMESLVIGSLAAALGTAFASTLARSIVAALSSTDDLVQLDLSIDARVLAYTAFATLVASLSFGLSSALAATRSSLLGSIGWSAKGASAQSTSFTFQRVLVVAQVAICFLLVVGSLLFVTTFRNLIGVDAGFRQEGITFSAIDFNSSKLSRETVGAVANQIVSSVTAAPGVNSASTTSIVPLSGTAWAFNMKTSGDPAPHLIYFTSVSPGYFSTMAMPVLAGRDINDHDTALSARVALVNQKAAQRLFGSANPIGKVLHTLAEPGFPAVSYEIVGLVRDAKYADLRSDIQPTAYAPQGQSVDYQNLNIVVRSSLTSASVGHIVENAVSAANPGLRVERSIDFRAQVLQQLSRERLLAWLSGFFGILAVGLGAIGLYGVVSYTAAGRRHEIGVRLALGATPTSVTWLMMRQVVALLGAGLVLGVAASLIASSAAAALLYGMTPYDLNSYVVAAAVLAAVVLIASFVPTRTAATIDPMAALRQD